MQIQRTIAGWWQVIDSYWSYSLNETHAVCTQYNVQGVCMYVCECVHVHICQCAVSENGLKCIKRLNQTIMTFKSKHKTTCKGGENGKRQMETGTSLVRWGSTPGFRVTKPAHTHSKQLFCCLCGQWSHSDCVPLQFIANKITWPSPVTGPLTTGKLSMV